MLRNRRMKKFAGYISLFVEKIDNKEIKPQPLRIRFTEEYFNYLLVTLHDPLVLGKSKNHTIKIISPNFQKIPLKRIDYKNIEIVGHRVELRYVKIKSARIKEEIPLFEPIYLDFTTKELRDIIEPEGI